MSWRGEGRWRRSCGNRCPSRPTGPGLLDVWIGRPVPGEDDATSRSQDRGVRGPWRPQVRPLARQVRAGSYAAGPRRLVAHSLLLDGRRDAALSGLIGERGGDLGGVCGAYAVRSGAGSLRLPGAPSHGLTGPGKPVHRRSVGRWLISLNMMIAGGRPLRCWMRVRAALALSSPSQRAGGASSACRSNHAMG
jgi:hypothetical protein